MGPDDHLAEQYLVEAGVILGVFVLLLSWPVKRRIKDSRTVDNLALALPIAWAILGGIWIYLRTSGIVSLPW